MLTLNAAIARVKRQKIEEFAGESFVHRDEVVKKIPNLKGCQGQQFLFGIYYSEGYWTVLSVNYLYASFDGELATLRLDTEADKIYDYFGVEGNDFSSEIHLKDGRRFWMKSPELASLVLNIMMMLKNVPCGTVLKE